jgi:hypothetical protein
VLNITVTPYTHSFASIFSCLRIVTGPCWSRSTFLSSRSHKLNTILARARPSSTQFRERKLRPQYQQYLKLLHAKRGDITIIESAKFILL